MTVPKKEDVEAARGLATTAGLDKRLAHISGKPVESTAGTLVHKRKAYRGYFGNYDPKASYKR